MQPANSQRSPSVGDKRSHSQTEDRPKIPSKKSTSSDGFRDFGPFSEHSTTTKLYKLVGNAHKALVEGYARDSTCSFNPEAILPSIFDFETTRLRFEITSREMMGRRSEMQDVSLVMDCDEGMLLGVFDGHGGQGVVKLVKEIFQSKFVQTLEAEKGDVSKTFKRIADEITAITNKESEYHAQGSTAVLNYIDRKANLIYTATLGDPGSTLYRKINNQWTAIPLSCKRTWASENDQERANIAIPGIVEYWQKNITHEKERRFPPSKKYGIDRYLNVSRAFGDKKFKDIRKNKKDKPAISDKFKITVNKLCPGDIIITACDGLWDFSKNEYIINQFGSDNPQLNLAEKIVADAYIHRNSTDNISVIALKVL